MANFFKNIRRKFLAEGRLRRYLLYAFGEIILVVIGILIALKINDWQKEKQDRREEKAYLASMVSDLELDLEDIRESNHFALRRIATSTWVLAQLGDSSTYFQPKTTLQQAMETAPVPATWTKDSIGIALSELLRLRIFDHHDVTYQELVSSSKIQVIRNKDLRFAINRHYSVAKKALNANEQVLAAQHNLLAALKAAGITPNTAAAYPDLLNRLRLNESVLTEIRFLRDMALHYLDIFEEKEAGPESPSAASNFDHDLDYSDEYNGFCNKSVALIELIKANLD
jgi:hypothetical protein